MSRLVDARRFAVLAGFRKYRHSTHCLIGYKIPPQVKKWDGLIRSANIHADQRPVRRGAISAGGLAAGLVHQRAHGRVQLARHHWLVQQHDAARVSGA